MGGLVSLYAWFRRPDVFGLAAALSPSLWYGRDRLFEYLRTARLPPGRLYLDSGTAEGATTLRDLRSLRALLAAKGMRIDDRLLYLEDRGAGHDESAWGRRLDGALEFLFRDRWSGMPPGRQC